AGREGGRAGLRRRSLRARGDAGGTTPRGRRPVDRRRARWPATRWDGARSRPAPRRRSTPWRRGRQPVSCSEAQQRLAQREGGQRREDTVETVEDPAVTGDQVSG